MTYPYARWGEAAQTIFASYGVPLRRSYTVRQLVGSQELRDAIRDTYYALYRYLRRNNIDRMGELGSDDNEIQIYAAEFIANLRHEVQKHAEEGNLDHQIMIDPGQATILDISRVRNWDAILRRETMLLEFIDEENP